MRRTRVGKRGDLHTKYCCFGCRRGLGTKLLSQCCFCSVLNGFSVLSRRVSCLQITCRGFYSVWIRSGMFKFAHTRIANAMAGCVILLGCVSVSRSQWPHGLRRRRSAFWDRAFESHRGHRCSSFVQCLCCEVEVSATGRSLVQRSPTDCGVCLSVIK
jgi:hypothetical protein